MATSHSWSAVFPITFKKRGRGKFSIIRYFFFFPNQRKIQTHICPKYYREAEQLNNSAFFKHNSFSRWYSVLYKTVVLHWIIWWLLVQIAKANTVLYCNSERLRAWEFPKHAGPHNWGLSYLCSSPAVRTQTTFCSPSISPHLRAAWRLSSENRYTIDNVPIGWKQRGNGIDTA